jgi:hypothetical protein
MPLSSGFTDVGDDSCQFVRTVLGILGISRGREVRPEMALVEGTRLGLRSRDSEDEIRIWRLVDTVGSRIRRRLPRASISTMPLGTPIGPAGRPGSRPHRKVVKVAGPRDHSSGTLAWLAALPIGTCYYQGLGQQMTDDRRRGFANLLLSCAPTSLLLAVTGIAFCGERGGLRARL